MADAVMQPALTATVVAVSTRERMDETARALRSLRRESALRTILISLGEIREPEVRTDVNCTTIDGILPRYLNNAVAALRLSSLPSIAWWRGRDVDLLPDLAELVDRLVLDAEDPTETWARIPEISGVTVVSDLRWAALTRWRNLVAQFLDVPDVNRRADSFRGLEIAGFDRYSAALLAGWLKSRLPAGSKLSASIDAEAPSTARSVVLAGNPYRLELSLLQGSTCIRTAILEGDRTFAERVVPPADDSPEGLMGGELRIRARDAAFEQALSAAREWL